jgi:aryl-alcohol dehydrogenase-like predicted oxidoreductase
VNYVNLGRTGLRVSRVCLGMMSYGKHESRPWTLDEQEAEPIVRQAVEGGVTFFDTADVYNGGQSEVITGRLLAKLFGMREEYIVATKVHGQTMPGENGRGLSRKHIMASIDGSLTRLNLDYVDLYQIIAGIPARRSRRRWTRCMTSSNQEKPATSAPAACTPGSSPKLSTWPAPNSSRCRTTTTSSTARRSGR